jgi:hypothetical protein
MKKEKLSKLKVSLKKLDLACSIIGCLGMLIAPLEVLIYT